jgi:hypothetical protein
MSIDTCALVNTKGGFLLYEIEVVFYVVSAENFNFYIKSN